MPSRIVCTVLAALAGVLQLWNVSQQQPLKSIKIGNGPAQSVQFFPGTSKALLTFQDGTVRCCNCTASTCCFCVAGNSCIFECRLPHNSTC